MGKTRTDSPLKLGRSLPARVAIAGIAASLALCGALVLSGCGEEEGASFSISTSFGDDSDGSVAEGEGAEGIFGSNDSYGWPQNTRTDGVPRLEGLSANTAIDIDHVTTITYFTVSEDVVRDYIAQLEEAGFTDVESETDDGASIGFVATNPDTEINVTLDYTVDSKTLVLDLRDPQATD